MMYFQLHGRRFVKIYNLGEFHLEVDISTIVGGSVLEIVFVSNNEEFIGYPIFDNAIIQTYDINKNANMFARCTTVYKDTNNIKKFPVFKSFKSKSELLKWKLKHK